MEHSNSKGALASVSSSPVPALAHSEELFGAFRDFWWNSDFLDLMAQRWQLMPDSQRLAQHIEQAWRGSPIRLCTFRHWQPQWLAKQ